MSRTRLAGAALAAALMALVIGLRFAGLGWDEGSQTHPDERFLSMVTADIELPGSLGEYLDAGESPANPANRGHGFFVYGTLPVLATEAVARLTGRESYWEVARVGRELSATLETVTALLAFVLGVRLHSRAAGLAALLLVGSAVIHVQHAHFFVVDPWLACFATLTVLALTCYAAGGRRGWAPAAGVALGLAVACKVSAAPLALPAGFALLVRARGERPARVAVDAVLLAVAAAVTVRLAYPYAFAPGSLLAPDPHLLESLGRLRASAGQLGFPPAVQWHGVSPGFALVQTVVWGTGIAAGVAGIAGVLLGLLRLLRGRWLEAAPAVAWIVVGTAFTAVQPVQPMRYMLPVTPALLTLGAVALVELGRWGGARFEPGWKRPLCWLPLAAACGISLAWSAAFVRIYLTPHVRAEATRWIADHVPEDEVIAIEPWDEPVPCTVAGMDPVQRPTAWLPIRDPSGPVTNSVLVAVLDSADWLVLASQRGYGAMPRAPGRFPASIRLYRALFGGELGWELAASFTDFPCLLGLRIDTSGADESLSVYDHPRVLIFRKTPAYDSVRARALVEEAEGAAELPDRSEMLRLVRELEREHRRGRGPRGE